MSLHAVSLRFRLIGLVALGMAVSLLIGGTAAGVSASRSVRNEMRAALGVAEQAMLNAAAASAGGELTLLMGVVRAFDGNRHVRLHIEGRSDPSAVPTLEPATVGAVPAWFARLIEVEPTVLRVPLALGPGRVETAVIETDPRNELVETWDAFCDTALILALFAGSTFLLIFLFVGRLLRPLGRLGDALAEVGRGEYGLREIRGLAPEIARLYGRFNEMSTRLAAADRRNRSLREQLLHAQESERRNIARDLHDEIGPFLFAAQVDAARVARLAGGQRIAGIAEALQSIAESLGHAQAQVRSMIARLRPAGLAEFGLCETLRELAEFWRARYPATTIRLELPPQETCLGEIHDITVYRLVQEGLSNALRHGRPSEVIIRLNDDRRIGSIAVEILDDGRGGDAKVAAEQGGGFGLLGLAERVEALAGEFSSGPLPAGGFRLGAVLPLAGSTEGEALVA